ncbi:MAG: hypothetical protein QNJ09_11345 [Paracoccaceae bacterium]|nr:hypothetical protein [Paracoccaceae bacterium]
MDYRLLLTIVALLPALVVSVLPVAALSGPVTMVVGSVGSLVAFAASLRPAPQMPESPSLLRRDALRQLPENLPELPEMRRALVPLLKYGAGFDAMTMRDQAISRALQLVRDRMTKTRTDALSDQSVRELFLLNQLLRVTPGEAGQLAQLFQRPDVVLDLRDQITQDLIRQAEFDRQHAIFNAALEVWRSDKDGSMREMLAALPCDDIDLWHHVVLNHDPHDAEQRQAALWCVQQAGCDRATVASWLTYLATDGHLMTAAVTGDTAYLQAVRDVIDAWNAGTYKRQSLALAPTDSLVGAAQPFQAALEELAQVTDSDRWPLPFGAFVEYTGRTPRPRDAWCLESGRLRTAPRAEDYLTDISDAA